jgi:hypothetical protein
VRLAVPLFAFAASAALAQSGGEARLRGMNIAFEPERLVQFAGRATRPWSRRSSTQA